jgi:hypothetical protein
MAGRRDEAKAAEWGRILQAWYENDLSVREFCELLDLRESSFYAWRRKLSRMDDGTPQCSFARRSDARVPAGQAKPQFVPVHVIEDEGAARERLPFIEVELPAGIRLRVPQGCDQQTLCVLIAALRGEAVSC